MQKNCAGICEISHRNDPDTFYDRSTVLLRTILEPSSVRGNIGNNIDFPRIEMRRQVIAQMRVHYIYIARLVGVDNIQVYCGISFFIGADANKGVGYARYLKRQCFYLGGMNF